MSIEEKAKRYDEAIERARKFATDLPNGRNDRLYHVWDLESIFPELKESEDAMIIRELISLFKDGIKCINHPYTGEDCERWVAWLEKQKAMEAKLIISDEGYNKAFQDGIEEVLTNPHKYGLEKQGEQKPAECDILSAKKGDMLSNGTIVLIVDSIAEFEGKPIINSWYFADSEKFYGKGTSECDRWAVGGFRTATEAECNYLLKMMADAGYEWDAEKKELKKITDEKQIKKNLQDNSFRRMFEQKQVIDYPDSLPKDNWELIHEFVNKFGRIPKDEDELNVLIEYVLKRQNPAWSEEDERNLDWLMTVCERIHYKSDPQVAPDSALMLKDWLRTLKDRVQPQPKQEWSEEDEKMLNQIIKDYERGNESWLKGQGSLPFGNRITWLKSLRPNHWKPSDEQMKALVNALSLAKNCGEEYAFDLRTLYEQLKKLKG